MRFCYGITAVLTCVGLLIPVANVDASHRYSNSNEGSSDYSSEQIRQWWGDSSRTRDRINDLDDDKEEDIAIPILFGVALDDLQDNFGDSRGGGARTHEGLDIMAPEGAPIVSPTEAVVLRTGTGSSAGKYVYTANPGGETFVYMHLSEIANGLSSGDRLDEGDLIGLVGDTGNAAPGAFHLHFEMRDDGAQDPLPRITEEYDLEEKMEFVENILDDVDDENDYAAFLVATYAADFIAAQSEDIDLPRAIEDALDDLNLTGDLEDVRQTLSLGDSGPDVTTLQAFLIRVGSGEAINRLRNAGATGYFGTITESALREFQDSVGLTVTGRYDAATRAYVQNLESADVSRSEDAREEVVAEASLGVIGHLLSNDLTSGVSNVEVSILQLFLMIKSSGPAAAQLTTAGATGYFGSLTGSALREYQTVVGLAATGIYDAETRSYIQTNE